MTNLETGSAERLYEGLYCARRQAENLIKLHKTQLASDRTSCRSPLANQVRLVLHTAAYWLLLTVRDAIPKVQDLARAEFTTLRLRLLKIAARITETKSRIRVAFATACPEAELFRGLAIALQRAGPCTPRQRASKNQRSANPQLMIKLEDFAELSRHQADHAAKTSPPNQGWRISQVKRQDRVCWSGSPWSCHATISAGGALSGR